ncbi:MAG: GNAT family N-acetyltransferase [Bacilli bacterium]
MNRVLSNITIRSVKKEDYNQIINLFNSLSDEDKKYLALKSKISLIKQMIKKESHCYVACIGDKVIGFLRESGRSNGFSLLEELVLDHHYRSLGIASLMLEYYHNNFNKNIAKTNAKNIKMISLLKKYNYIPQNRDALRIINWQRLDN